jgi:NitT/TauT family transport system ATP-binding protein
MSHTGSLDAPSRKVRLSVQGVSKSFLVRGKRGGTDTLLQVLRRMSFDVYENEIVSLIGESGCGKTTLLRIVQGLVKRDAGDIRVDGLAVKGPGRDRGFVFQQASLLPWRSARANIEFGLELQGVDKPTRAARAQALLELVGLENAGEQYPHELSGGMQQRVGLARALAINPTILLMDEPFSALDAQTREVLQKELLRIQAETRKTVLFVTHDLDEAIYVSNRVLVLGARPGRIKQIIDIPFPQDRPELPELRGDPEFQRIRSQMWDLIRDTGGQAAGSTRAPDAADKAGRYG